MKVKHQLFLGLTTVVAVPLLWLGLTTAGQQETDALEEDRTRGHAQALAIANDTTEFVDRFRESVEGLAAHAGRVRGTEKYALQELVNAQAEHTHGASFMYVAGVEGRSLAAWSRGGAGPGDVGVDYSGRDYFVSARDERTVVLSRVQIGKRTRLPNIQVAAPIQNEAGGFAGIAEGSVDLSMLQTVVDRVANSGPNTQAAIVDEFGFLIVHSDRPISSALQNVSQSPVFSGPLVETDYRIIEDVGGTQLRVTRLEYDVGGKNWVFAVMRPEHAVAAGARSTRAVTITATLVALLAALFASVLLATGLSAPIIRLAQLTQTVSAGEKPEFPTLRSWHPSELHQLTDDFTMMVRSIHRQGKLQERLVGKLSQERASLRSLNSEIAMLYDAASALSKNVDYQAAEATVLRSVCKAVGWGYASLLLLTGEQNSRFACRSYYSNDPATRIPCTGARVEPSTPLALAMQSATVAVFQGPLDSMDSVEVSAREQGFSSTVCVTVTTQKSGRYVLQFFGTTAVPPLTRRILATLSSLLGDHLDRTHQLEQVRATQNLRMERLEVEAQGADERNQRKTEYLAHVSHEIRTPMNAILGMSELLLTQELVPQQLECASIIRDSTRALLGVINSSLDLTKIEAGELSLVEEPFDLWSLVDDCCQLLAHTAHNLGLGIRWKIDHRIPRAVCGDAGRFRQVLTNLVGNAIKFTEEGSVEVALGLEEATEDTCQLRVIVSDSGDGIPEEEFKTIFRPFTQLPGKAHVNGTGLGLPISQALASLMDTNILVESKIGVGTTMSFSPRFRRCSQRYGWHPPKSVHAKVVAVAPEVPCGGQVEIQLEKLGVKIVRTSMERVPQEADFLIIEAEKAHSGVEALCEEANHEGVPTLVIGGPELRGETPQLRGGTPSERSLAEHLLRTRTAAATPRATKRVGQGKILVVDDSPLNRLIVCRFLKLWGYEYIEANDGDVAVQCWKDDGADLILMDCQMPRIDGLQATRLIRNAEVESEHVPIVALTAAAMTEDAARCFAVGMDGYLAKPVVPEELHAEIKRLLCKVPAEA